jgi:hypothetical protein
MGQWRKWNIDDVVPSADVQELNESSIMAFDSAAQRQSQLGATPTSGQTTFIRNSNSAELRIANNNWMPLSFTNSSGKNLFLNGDFAVTQRGLGVFTNNNSYTADRWFRTESAAALFAEVIDPGTSNATPSLAGNSYYTNTQGNILRLGASSSTVGMTNTIGQRFEGSGYLVSTPVTLSFWLRSNFNATINIKVIRNNTVTTETSTVFSASTGNGMNWQYVTIPFVMPATNLDFIGGFTEVRAEITNASDAYTVDLWQMQLEIGSAATPFQLATANPIDELTACQRYLYRTPLGAIGRWFGSGLGTAANLVSILIDPPIQLRSLPNTGFSISDINHFALTDSVTNVTALTSMAIVATDTFSNFPIIQVTKAASFTVSKHYKLAATSASAFLQFDGEIY